MATDKHPEHHPLQQALLSRTRNETRDQHPLTHGLLDASHSVLTSAAVSDRVHAVLALIFPPADVSKEECGELDAACCRGQAFCSGVHITLPFSRVPTTQFLAFNRICTHLCRPQHGQAALCMRCAMLPTEVVDSPDSPAPLTASPNCTQNRNNCFVCKTGRIP